MTKFSDSLTVTASRFELLCSSYNNGLFKIAYIRKMPKGYWGVYSHKGKLLGKYKTKQEATHRLRSIEYWKHHKSASPHIEDEVTYTALLRTLNKTCPPEISKEFKKTFKSSFDQALLNNIEEPEKVALNDALSFIDSLDICLEKSASLHKYASEHELGDPISVGKYLAALIKFILRKISTERRSKSIYNLRNKIYALNEYELANKRMPSAASIGQAITIVKHLMFGKTPSYIRQVLNSIAINLG